ncbi:porin [Caballeronia sp. LZ043]|uniref:porin n=1 Tax=Caballeronia sp. LZ043 TaxID=3038569 RepID=UPI002860E167|nr:porin [Caballeronia sp. LZ043]MDR5822460.1 porin [Caballeronia sp. LZ043]
MGNRMIRNAALALFAAVSAPAWAQSSVTLYGVIDEGLMYVHNSGGHSTQLLMSSGNLYGSRWGLKGTEDLGGGLSAIFRLENGFDINSGALAQGGREFGRQAYVGLSHAKYGTLTLGRQYDPLLDLVQPVQGDYYLGSNFSTPGDVDAADWNTRFSNTIKWASPTWGGVNIEAMYALGGVAGATGSGQTYAGAASYGYGPFLAAAGYLHIDNGNAQFVTRGTSTADVSSLTYSAVNNAYASARSIDIARGGAHYVVGPVTLGGYFSHTEYKPDSASTYTVTEKYNDVGVYGFWQIRPDTSLEIGYDYLKSSGDSSARYHQVGVSGDYVISKRTDFYAVVGYTHASGSNGAGAAQAVVGAYDINSGKNSQVLAIVGIKHVF